MEYYLIILLAGLAGSMHCVGMCGGFACILGRDGRGRLATLARHLVYNLGRVTSYCFMGVCVGYLGFLLVGHGGDDTWGSLAQRTLALLSGLLMLYIGLQFLGLLPRSAGPLLGVDWLASGLRQLTRSTRPGAPLALGVLNGFLPCPLVYAFLAQAAGSGGPLSGLLIMATFGLGTFPAMLAMGGIGWWAGCASCAAGCSSGSDPVDGARQPAVGRRLAAAQRADRRGFHRPARRRHRRPGAAAPRRTPPLTAVGYGKGPMACRSTP
jgi:uncharacterized protein